MSQDLKSIIHFVHESVDLPRSNGEIIFNNPWEGRVFAMAMYLYEQGIYPWKSFNEKFVQEIGEAERQHPDVDVVFTYYQHWMKALEKELLEKGVLSQEQLDMRMNEFATGQRHHVC